MLSPLRMMSLGHKSGSCVAGRWVGWGEAPGLGTIPLVGYYQARHSDPTRTPPSPVIILCQGNLLKVQVQPLALGSLKQPVAGEVVAVVAREAGGDDAAGGGVADHSTAGSCETGRTVGLAPAGP